MSHALLSIQHIKELVPEPWKMALISRAAEKGVTYTLKCVHTGTIDKPTGDRHNSPVVWKR